MLWGLVEEVGELGPVLWWCAWVGLKRGRRFDGRWYKNPTTQQKHTHYCMIHRYIRKQTTNHSLDRQQAVAVGGEEPLLEFVR